MASLHVITCAEDSKNRLHNVDTGEVTSTMDAPANCWHACQISSTEFAAACDDNTVLIYNAQTSQRVRTLTGHSDNVKGCVWMPRVQRLATGSEDNTVKIWDASVDAGAGVQATMSGHTADIYVMDHSISHPNWVFSGADDNSARVWDIATEACLKVIQDHENNVDGLCSDSEHQILFTGSDDKTAKAFDLRTWEKVADLGPYTNYLRSICFRQRQCQLILPCHDGRITVLDVRMIGSPQVVAEWSGHDSGHCIYGSCDMEYSDYFITSSWDNEVKAWRDDGTMVWQWHSNRDPRGVHPFIANFEVASLRRGGGVGGRYTLDDDRLEYALHSTEEFMKVFRVKVKVRGRTEPFFLCRSFLSEMPGLKEELETIRVTDKLRLLKPEIVQSVLAGDDSRLEGKHLLDLYLLFNRLNMKKHAYLTCQKVQTVKKTSVLLYLAAHAMKRFELSNIHTGTNPLDELDENCEDELLEELNEEEEEDDDNQSSSSTFTSFVSAFTLATFNALANCQNEITGDKRLAAVCQRHGLLGRLLSHKAREIREHREFLYSEEKAPSSFGDIAQQLLKDLGSKQRWRNVWIVANDGETKFKAHLDVLLMRSRVFFPMLQAGGEEIESLVERNEIHLPMLGGDGIEAVLSHIYNGRVSANDFSSLIQLYRFGAMYQEEDLVQKVDEKLSEVCETLKEEGRLEEEVTGMRDFIDQPEMIETIARIWGMSGERFALVLDAAKLEDARQKFLLAESRLGTRLSVLERDMDRVEDRVGQLKERLLRRLQ